MACRVAVLILTSLIVFSLVGCGGGGGGGGDTVTFTGRVLHSQTQEPIQGVAVSISGRTALTDADGAYTICVPQGDGTYLCSFTKDGFKDAGFRLETQGICLGPHSLEDVIMTPLPD